MEEILQLILKRQGELKSDLERIDSLSANALHHSSRVNDALQDSIRKIDPEKKAVVQQLMGIINQIPGFVEAGFTELDRAKRASAERFNELKMLEVALVELEEQKERKKKNNQELLKKIESGEITEETITGPREAGVRPESLATYRKLTEMPTKLEG